MRLFSLFLLFLYVGALLFAHNIFVQERMYERMWWADGLLHVLGGVGVVLSWRFLGGKSMGGAMLAILAVSIAWEGLEFFISTPFFGTARVSFDDSTWLLDTLTDIGVGVFSGALFWFLISRYTKDNV